MKKIFAVSTMLLAVLMVAPVFAKGGYDEFGYNYQAHIFNGRYCDADRVSGGPYEHVTLVMKWNDAWLSKDRERPDSYIGSGAWCTNHQRATEEDGTHWVYFVKIVALDYPKDQYTYVIDSYGTHVYYEGVEVGILIWGQFVITQRVYNEQGGPHGIEYLVQPAGFGASG